MGGTLAALFEEFQVARRSAKPSPQSQRAARADFASIHAHLQEIVGADEIDPVDVDAKALRLAFGRFADNHAAASVARAWSTWNQFYGFLVAEDIVGGNPMPAVARPKIKRRTPKPLQGDDAPEQLLATAAAGTRPARWPWPGTGPGLPGHRPARRPAALRADRPQCRVDRRSAGRTAHQRAG